MKFFRLKSLGLFGLGFVLTIFGEEVKKYAPSATSGGSRFFSGFWSDFRFALFLRTN
jgi:hypothetical protein